MENRRNTDPAIAEIIRSALKNGCNEARDVLVRGSYSIVIKEMHDCSVGCFDAKGNMVAVGLHLPVHIGSLSFALKSVIKKFTGRLKQGDMIMFNDPFEGGLHLYDISIFYPIFYQDEIVAFCGVLAHHADVGSAQPGYTTDSENIYQEGLRISGVRIVERGMINEDILDVIKSNFRLARDSEADIKSQIAANLRFEKQFLALLSRYGLCTVMRVMQETINNTEICVKNFIESLPDGTYEGRDNGNGELPEIKVRISKSADKLAVDFTGSADQVDAGINLPYAGTWSILGYVINVLAGSESEFNEGYFANVNSVTPAGTIVNPVLPAAVALYPVTAMRLSNLLLRTFCDFVTGRVGGLGALGGFFNISSAQTEYGEIFSTLEVYGGGTGASREHDGIDFYSPTPAGGGMKITPAELLERPEVIAIERIELRKDSGGAGKYRGGLGGIIILRCLRDSLLAAGGGGKTAEGLNGGGNGAGWQFILNPGTPSQKYVENSSFKMMAGDVMEIHCGGGGGYGNPFERNPEYVLSDVVNDRVSIKAAKELYGVIIDENSFSVDLDATISNRKKFLSHDICNARG